MKSEDDEASLLKTMRAMTSMISSQTPCLSVTSTDGHVPYLFKSVASSGGMPVSASIARCASAGRLAGECHGFDLAGLLLRAELFPSLQPWVASSTEYPASWSSYCGHSVCSDGG